MIVRDNSFALPGKYLGRIPSVYLVIATLILAAVIFDSAGIHSNFPDWLRVNMADPVNDWAEWFADTFRFIFRPISLAIQSGLKQIDKFIVDLPWTWVLLVIVVFTWKMASAKLAAFAFASFLFTGLIGLWDETLVTMNIMIIAVVLTMTIGIPLGILMALNDRMEYLLRPILDAMQTMPIFVYLIPVMLLFGVGGTSALFATIIYSVPPVVRLTNLGIRHVPSDDIEVARSFGSTPLQMLFKVQLPLARHSIMAGVNQTIMMALGMVIFVALLGGSGLGKEIWYAMRRLEVGRSVEAGIAVVLLAIYLDRLSLSFSGSNTKGKTRTASSKIQVFNAFSEYCTRIVDVLSSWVGRGILSVGSLGNRAQTDEEFQANILSASRILVGIVFLGLAYSLATFTDLSSGFPKDWRIEFKDSVDAVVKWMTVNLNGITKAFRFWMYTIFLNPIRGVLTWMPWPIVIGVVAILANIVSGWRTAMFAAFGFFFIGIAGMWSASMITMSQILVAVLFSILVAIPIGVLMAKSDRVEMIMRPILDTMQTLPAFVYFPIVIFLFRVGELSGIIATIIYAIPPAARMTNLGLRLVSEQVMEPAESCGSTPWQTLSKVQFPLALPSIMAGVNQTTMLALAMVVYAALIGAQGLGMEVMSAIGKFNVGRGFESGMSIVLLAVIFDRITQGWAAKKAKLVAAK